jgi:hypothetical protein
MNPASATIVRILGLLSASTIEYVPINCIEAFNSFFMIFELSAGVPFLLILLIALTHAWRVRKLSLRYKRMNHMLWSNCSLLIFYFYYISAVRITSQVPGRRFACETGVFKFLINALLSGVRIIKLR